MVELRERIVASTQEIFSTMVMMEVTVADDIPEITGKLENTITGVIGLAGTHKGVLAIHTPHDVAFAITGSFLGLEVSEVNEDVEDAIGEIANMLGGNIKAILSEKGRDIDLSLPSTVSGKEYDFHSIKGAEKTLIAFQCDSGRFIVDLQLEV